MLHSNSVNSKILLTTPDYPPQLGGLSTFCRNIENALKALGINYDLLVWKSSSSLSLKDELTHSYEWGIHIHYQGGLMLASRCGKNINFMHGSEILFTSPNFIKKLVKLALKTKALSYLSKSHFNIGISEFTLNKVYEKGLKPDYGRDFVFHNCIDLGNSFFVKKSLSDKTIRFICVARDVPHKNILGALSLVESFALKLNRPVEFYCTKELQSSALVNCINIQGRSDEELTQTYKSSHFNLLLSLDDSNKGFYEGFGLTVLEAGCWGTPSIVANTGGLPEACHHLHTGWVLDNFSQCDELIDLITDVKYSEVSRAVYEHTHSSHDRIHYERLFKRILS